MKWFLKVFLGVMFLGGNVAFAKLSGEEVDQLNRAVLEDYKNYQDAITELGRLPQEIRDTEGLNNFSLAKQMMQDIYRPKIKTIKSALDSESFEHSLSRITLERDRLIKEGASTDDLKIANEAISKLTQLKKDLAPGGRLSELSSDLNYISEVMKKYPTHWESIVNALKNAANKVKDAWNSLKDAITGSKTFGDTHGTHVGNTRVDDLPGERRGGIDGEGNDGSGYGKIDTTHVADPEVVRGL